MKHYGKIASFGPNFLLITHSKLARESSKMGWSTRHL